MQETAVIGCLLGTAVGDALGLPYEGLCPDRAARLLGPPTAMRLLPGGRGMVSDDTEHALMTAVALLTARQDPDVFAWTLAWSLRGWVVALPAGVGLATARACIRLWLGVPPHRSGVNSAGNGPAMRAPILGVCLGADRDRLKEFVLRSTRLTHTDPKAYWGALAVALAAHHAAERRQVETDAYLHDMNALLRDDEQATPFLDQVRQAADSARRAEPLATFAASRGLARGISGYILHTVPCVLQVWLRRPDDYASGVQEIISAGGDADTTAAILGGIIGARVGKAGIPAPWLQGLWEWPRDREWMEALARALASGATHPPPWFIPGVLPRNVFFLAVVLAHGFRRLF